MMLYKNMKAMVYSLDGNTHFFDVVRENFVRIYISAIYVYNLPRLDTSNVDRSNKRKRFYTKKGQEVETITDADYADDLVLLLNIPAQAESLHHGLEHAARSIGLYKNTNEMKFMCFR